MLSAKEFHQTLLTLGGFVLLLAVTTIEAQIQSRIVGGVTTTVSQHQHMVHLIFDGVPMCGGSLLADRWIVTAAHCANHHKDEPARFQARGGTSFLTGNDGVKRQVEKIIIHPNFNPTTLNNDIAMLKLSQPMTGTNIKTIKLSTVAVPNGAMVSVSGWGSTKAGALVPSNQLRTVSLKKISQAACKKRFPRITVNMICAEEPGKGKCKGDSGGPMVYKSALVAVVSFGAGCGNKNSPGVYASAMKQRTFITNTMKNN